MRDEFDALTQNNTWTLVPKPTNANVVFGKWVFRHKFHADGTLARYKARWVCRGFSQQEIHEVWDRQSLSYRNQLISSKGMKPGEVEMKLGLRPIQRSLQKPTGLPFLTPDKFDPREVMVVVELMKIFLLFY